MESIIAQQKIARRRSFVGIQSGHSASPRSSHEGQRRSPRPSADFFLLEGGNSRSYADSISLRSRPGSGLEKSRSHFPGPSSRTPKPSGEKRGRPGRGLPRFRSGFRPWSLLPKLGRGLAAALAGLSEAGLDLLRARGRPAAGLKAESAAPAEAARGEGGRQADPAFVRKLLPLAFGALFLAGLVLGFGLLARPSFPLPASGLLPGGSAEDALLAYLSPELSEPPTVTEIPAPPRSLEIERYTVRPGDSLGAIAARHGLSMDSLVSMNGIKSARGLRAGTELKIPNMNGLVHVVLKGESLLSIAAKYQTELVRLADANDLGTSVIQPGQSLFIPGARLAPSEIKRVLGELTIWPLRGPISSYFGYRSDPFTGVRRFHAGLDIVAPSGSPINAAMDGRVADQGYNAVFGNYLIVNHAEGMQSLYGHLSAFSVKRGQTVAQGQRLGAVGSTGYSTGPHLHFALYKGGSPINPLKYLK